MLARRPIARPLSLVLLVLSACPPPDRVRVVNAPPASVILSPQSGASLPLGEPVTFVGEVDDQDGLETVDVTWTSTHEGTTELCDRAASTPEPIEGGKGRTTCTYIFDDAGLEGKTVQVALNAVDDAAVAADPATVSITFYDPDGVSFEIINPVTGDWVPTDLPLPVTTQVRNLPDGFTAENIEILDDDNDVLCTGTVDEEGFGACNIELPEGEHYLHAALYGVTSWDTGETGPLGDLLATSPTVFLIADPDVADVDGDGHYAGVDCDDADADVHPGAQETWYDGVDQDCDQDSDYDQDGDGFDDAATLPSGSDCDDTDANVSPVAAEICDGLDQDCDGQADQGVTTTHFADGDTDGYGDASVPAELCSTTSGWVTNDDDCDDTRSSVRPGASESCNGLDDDCDTTVDDGVGSAWYVDADGDGYGSGSAVISCSAPSGYVSNSGDCNDGEPRAWTGAAESCDSVDNDCDGSTDEALSTTYYRDADGDGYGTPSTSSSTCAGRPSGYVTNDDDCNDGESAVYPYAPDACDGVDNDCDTSDGSDESTCAPFELTFYDDDANNSSCTETTAGTGADEMVTTLTCDTLTYPDRHAMMIVEPTESCVAGATITLWDYSGCNSSHGSTVVSPSCSSTQYYDLNCLGSGGIADEVASVSMSR